MRAVEFSPPISKNIDSPTRLIALAASLCFAATAVAQYQIQQDGRMAEVNPQIGGNGLNHQAAPPPMLGNASTSGNLSGGLSFRGVTTIPSANGFRSPLGSGALATFRRDSVAISDSRLPLGGLGTRLYFDPATTVRSSGFLLPSQGGIQQAITPGYTAGQLGSAGPVGTSVDPRLDNRIDARLPSTQYSTGTSGLVPGNFSGLQGVTIDVPTQTPRNSNLNLYQRDSFGNLAGLNNPAQTVTDYNPDNFGYSDTQPLINPITPTPNVYSTNEYGRLAPRLDVAQPRPLETRTVDAYQGGLNLSPSLQLGNKPTQVHTGRWAFEGEDTSQQPYYANARDFDANYNQPITMQTGQPNAGGLNVGNLQVMNQPGMQQQTATSFDPNATTPQYAANTGVAGTALPGSDVFGDMQIAMELQRDPRAPWFADMQNQVRSDPTLTGMLDEKAQLNSQDFVTRVLSQPVRSLANNSKTQVNEALRAAEQLLDSGQYFDAVGRFEIAHAMDPTNPLPLLGKGHAQLAAGELMSAAYNVLRALELYPDLARLNLDLRELVGGGETVDIRRSQLMQRLETKEDTRLRFLLGYLEYFAGYRDRGLNNLQKAAQQDFTGSIISRLPRILTGGANTAQPSASPSSSYDLSLIHI